MAKQPITFRMLLWILIAYIALPFVVVLIFSFWLQDLVAGANKHKWSKYKWSVKSDADTTDPR